jgi:hypothetical protein
MCVQIDDLKARLVRQKQLDDTDMHLFDVLLASSGGAARFGDLFNNRSVLGMFKGMVKRVRLRILCAVARVAVQHGFCRASWMWKTCTQGTSRCCRSCWT